MVLTLTYRFNTGRENGICGSKSVRLNSFSFESSRRNLANSWGLSRALLVEKRAFSALWNCTQVRAPKRIRRPDSNQHSDNPAFPVDSDIHLSEKCKVDVFYK